MEYVLSFIRIALVIGLMPSAAFSRQMVHLKMVLAMLLCVCITPWIPKSEVVAVNFSIAIWNEAILGVLFGLSLYAITQVFGLLGNVISAFSGFSFAMLIEPITGKPNQLFAGFFGLLAAVLFFSLDLHLLVMTSMINLFRNFPLGESINVMQVVQNVSMALLLLSYDLLVFAMPFAVFLILISVGFVMVGRNKVEFNLFSLGIPIMLATVFCLLFIEIDNIIYVSSISLSQYIEALFHG